MNSSSPLHSMPTAPCPIAGRLKSVGRISVIASSWPRRFTPAVARIIASNSPSLSFLRRVSTLPRSWVIFRSGRRLSSWHILLRLLVPTFAPCGRSLKLFMPFPAINASLGSSRFVMQGRCKPSGNSVGTSFMLCTARSASPLSIASSISLTKRPLPPTCASGTSRILSPVVLILFSSTSNSGSIVSSCDFIHSACHRASLLWRVAITILRFAIIIILNL